MTTAATAPTKRRAADQPASWVGGLVALLVLAVVSLFVGVQDLSVRDLFSGLSEGQQLVLMVSRIPRTVAVLLAGASLAMAGLLMQLLVRNRYVEPSTVGTTESASVGVLVMTLFFPGSPVPVKMLVAVVTALLGTWLFIRIIRSLPPKAPVVAVPLVGIMLSGVIAAGTTYVAYANDLLQALNTWMAGDFAGVLAGRYELLWLLAVVGAVVWVFADRFTVASLGKDMATGLGLNYKQTVNLGLALVAVASGITLVVVGAIPFVGLIVPNLISMWLGDNLRRNIGWSALFGAGFVLVCDLLARTINFPYEVPVGTISGVLGGVVFLFLLLSGRMPTR
ncbi:ABC transporter permease [Tessaracoccus oleiagri]|uniref:Iron complex transport system permease protein n=1 Tax=Tessaracoccus oleiagri TaxID=686624 RepID=A0A1G9JS44_9ACTN|nr:iron chelate uptake ABC transporter family permease subunit [Tessaracoccus oleiagri]SDL40347.1 iron complex transport system permease protein [Tessaracoccus oleiagri]